MSFVRKLFLLTLAVSPSTLIAQNPAAAPSVSRTLRPALSQVAQALDGLNIRRWKAPNEVRDAAENDVASIQRDLSGTLAGLLEQSDAAPGSVPAAFAVYRNVDALYDTLLRVVQTAELAAPDNEATGLEAALRSLESARSTLGDTILSGSQAQQVELTRLRTVIAAAAAAQRAPVRTTVVNDGPAKEPETSAKPKHTTRKHSSSHPPSDSSQRKPTPQ